jgi:deoxyribose-phosphate aldolase
VREIEESVKAGAREIDIVISRRHVLTGNWQALYDEMRDFRAACGEAHVKAILATGELGTLRNVARASLICMMAGADFIKTSTGKESVNATLPVTLTMVRAIRAYEAATGFQGGLQARGRDFQGQGRAGLHGPDEGGIGRSLAAQPDLFRFGASSLLGDIERQLEHHVTGRLLGQLPAPDGMKTMTDVPADIFANLEYGPAPESDGEVRDWLAAHTPFGHVIDGKTVTGPTFATQNPATGDVLAEVAQGTVTDVDRAVKAARRAQPKWAALSGHATRAHLYALARSVQKNARALAVLETLDTGKPIRESRDIDLPLVARHFYYHAGMAQLMAEELPDREALGVCGQIIPWNFPLLMLAWKVAPALAMGNTVVLKPAEQTPLTALMFADWRGRRGCPRGCVNIVTGDGETGQALVAHPGVDKIAFTGSTTVGARDPGGHGGQRQGADARAGWQIALHRVRRRGYRQRH